jgi:hypothetical protein
MVAIQVIFYKILIYFVVVIGILTVIIRFLRGKQR